MKKEYWGKFEYRVWLGDTALSTCSALTRGVWIDAIARMMEGGTDRISGSITQLARLCRCSEAEMLAAIEELRSSSAAEIVEQNSSIQLVSKKRRRELEIKELKKQAGAAGGSKTQAQAKQIQEMCLNFASSTSYSDSSSPNGLSDGGEGGAEPEWMDDADFQVAWQEWETHRREIAKPLTPLATKKLRHTLAAMGKERAIAAINHSIARQWQGIYESRNVLQVPFPVAQQPSLEQRATLIGSAASLPARPRELWQVKKDIESVREAMAKVLEYRKYGYTGAFNKMKAKAEAGDKQASEDLQAYRRLEKRRDELEAEGLRL